MKILVIGMSPYLVTARAKLTALVMEHLLLEGHSVAGAVYSHDPNFFIPDAMPDGKERFFYKFGERKVPLNLFSKNSTNPPTPVAVYEIINALKPDIVVGAGDHRDFLYLKAVKSFLPDFRIVFVLANQSTVIAEENVELFDEADGILCTSQASLDTIEKIAKCPLDVAFVGPSNGMKQMDREVLRKDRKIENRFRIISCNRTFQSDQLACLMEACSVAREAIPELSLYLHSNAHDNGDYNLFDLKTRFDPNNEFISLPDRFVSLFEGVSDEELAQELNASDLFVSMPMTSGTSMSAFDAIACGCRPLMSCCGSNRYLGKQLAAYLTKNSEHQYVAEDFLMRGTKLMESDGSYLTVVDPELLAEKIVKVYHDEKNRRGMRTSLSQFIGICGRDIFLRKLSNVVANAPKQSLIRLETV